MRLLVVGATYRPNDAYFSGLPRLAKSNPRHDNFPATNVPSWDRGLGKILRDGCLLVHSLGAEESTSGLRYPKIIPAGQSSLAGFGKRQRAWPVAADAFDIG